MKNTAFVILALLLVLVMAFSFGCQAAPEEPKDTPAADAPEDEPSEEPADQPEGAKTYHIGYALDTYSNAINAQTVVLLEAECKARGYELTVTDGEKDASKQIDDINTLINKGVDGILVLPIDGNSVAEGVENAYEAGIPIATVLRDMPTVADKYVCFSGCDDVELGSIAGQWIVDALGGKGKVVYITGIPGVSTAENRTKGFHSVVDKYPDIEIIVEQAANYSRSEAMTVMEAILQANPEIDAVWCANDEMAGGAYSAIEAAGREDILLGGANFQKDAYERILAGTQNADITTPPQMVIAALDAVITTLEGGTVEKTLYYPLDLITKDNVDQFLDQVY